MVEARGVEPLSENRSAELSPSAADFLRFPSRNAKRQALRYGSRPVMTKAAASLRSRSPLSRRLYLSRGGLSKDGSLIRPREQQYCCRLFLKLRIL